MSDTRTWFDAPLAQFEAIVDITDGTTNFWPGSEISWDSLRPSDTPQSLDEWLDEAMRSLEELERHGHLAVYYCHENAINALDAIQFGPPSSLP